MALSNTAVPKYYGMFRDAVLRGKIPICREIELESYCGKRCFQISV